jgi:hypothetical protein
MLGIYRVATQLVGSIDLASYLISYTFYSFLLHSGFRLANVSVPWVTFCLQGTSLLWRMASSGMLHHVGLVRIDVSEELSASFIRLTRIGEQGTKLAVNYQPTHAAKKYQVFLHSVRRLLVTANVVHSSPIIVTLMKEALRSSEHRLLQEPHGVTSQKTSFFIVTAVETSNLTCLDFVRFRS